MNTNKHNTAQPLTEEQIWGDDIDREYFCPLVDDNGQCPEGCDECDKFNIEME